MGLGASASQAQATRAIGKAAAPDKYLMTSRVLRVPLQLDRALIPKLKEVCLYGKESGGDWKCLARVVPTAFSITFEVPRDGEYALQLVTVDQMGRTFPSDLNKATPDMIVVVDTKQSTTQPVNYVSSSLPEQSTAKSANSATGLANSPGQDTKSLAAPPLLAGTLPTIRDGSAPDAKPDETSRMGRRQYLNTPRVGLDYVINKSGPSGISKIDVYVTNDREAGWKLLTSFNEPRNRLEVDLPGEGVFGIRLVATNGNGFGNKIPGPADNPSAVFEVDLTGPELKVDVDPVTKDATMDIRWQVSDKNLSPEPIQIFYAPQAGGPWQLVAKAPNDGVYHWALPRDLPAHFVIRVEARDLAGNVSRSDCPNPVPLDLTEPDLNLVGVAPIPVPPATTGPGQ
jgi:hypothetical protein